MSPSAPPPGPDTIENVSSQVSASVAPSVMGTGVPTTVLALVFEATGGWLGAATATVTVAMLLSSLPSFALYVNV